MNLVYENTVMIEAIVEAIRPFLGEGEEIIRRGAFRWRNDDGVLSAHYECMSLAEICSDFNKEVVADFHHIAVVRRK